MKIQNHYSEKSVNYQNIYDVTNLKLRRYRLKDKILFLSILLSAVQRPGGGVTYNCNIGLHTYSFLAMPSDIEI